MDDDIRNTMQRAAKDLTAGGDGTDAVRRAARTSAQRHARTTMATFTLVAIAAAGVVRISTNGEPAGTLINPAATGSVRPEDRRPSVGTSATFTATPPPSTPRQTPTPDRTPTAKPTPMRSPSQNSCRVAKGTTPPKGVTVTVAVAKHTYLTSEPITIDITVRNDGPTPVAYSRGSGQEFELWAIGEDGDMWAYSNGLVFTQEMRKETLAPGESRTRTAVWDQSTCAGPKVRPGAYSVMGSWKASQSRTAGGGWMADPIALEITQA